MHSKMCMGRWMSNEGGMIICTMLFVEVKEVVLEVSINEVAKAIT